jgi:GNAT superfamily N-acetyltransferase
MWRSERLLIGPDRATVKDIAALNRLFSDAFTDRYRRDGMQGVRVPYLNPAVWQYALGNAGEGAMLWRDGRGDIVAFNLAHLSGGEGWMGPLAVRQDRQGQGLGRQIVLEGVRWLQDAGASCIGLETMPRTIENIGFYSRLGFTPGPLTVTLQGDAIRGEVSDTRQLGSLASAPRAVVLNECRELTQRLVDRLDFTRECELTLRGELGDVAVVRNTEGAVVAYAVWHGVALAQGRSLEDLRILKLVAIDLAAAQQAITAVSDEAARRRVPHVTARVQASHAALYSWLIKEHWRVHWTDLRMTLATHPEPVVQGVVLSNWEI